MISATIMLKIFLPPMENFAVYNIGKMSKAMLNIPVHI